MQTTNQYCRTTSATATTLLIIAVTVIAGCSSFTPRPVSPISNITEAAKNGESSERIISNLRESKTVYALRGSDFAKLDELGVPMPVLDELQQRFFGEVEFLTKRWYMRRAAGGPKSFYPQPLDLDNLKQGGDGMAPTTDVGRITHGTRPVGVPEWVPPYPALRGGVISVDTVLEMTGSGQPTQGIVDKVLASRVGKLYVDSPQFISRARTAAITGSMYADLAKQGVAPQVLDALQATYLASHVETSRLAAPVPSHGGTDNN